MLSLLDPIELEELQVFRDDEDTATFYPMPDQPVIPLDEEGQADFLMINYLKDLADVGEGEESGGGLVMFRSVLSIDPERRERLVEGLRALLAQEKAAGKKPFGMAITSTEPVIGAPLWTSGQAGLSTFRVSDDGLVRHATETVPVDLAGDLGASFVVELDEDGAEIFWTAFEDSDQQIPMVVTYELKYKARVAASMTIKASREIVQKRMWSIARPYRLAPTKARWTPMAFTGTFNQAALAGLKATNPFPVKAMIAYPAIRATLSKAILDQDIEVRIETDTADAQGDGGSDAVRDALFEMATTVLADRVIPAMFGESQPGADDDDDRSSRYDVVEILESGQTGIDFDMTVDHLSTVERSLNPNGPIRLLLGSSEAVASSFKQLRLTDGFFSAMKVSASTAGVNFERDGISEIKVDLEYEERDDKNPDRPWIRRQRDGVLRSDSEVLHFAPFDTARTASGGHKRNYRYKVEVHYVEALPKTVSDWQESSSRNLLITPQGIGALRVDVALTAPASIVESARVALRHEVPGGRSYAKNLELKQDTRRSWFQPIDAVDDDPLTQPSYDYQVTYRTAGDDIVMPWETTSEELLEIPTPFVQTLQYHVRPQGSFEGVSHVSGDLVYEDEARDYRVQHSFSFTGLSDSESFSIPVLADGPENATWRARLHFEDGSSQDLGSGVAEPGTVWVGGSTSFLEVEILPDLVDFEGDVQLALVTLDHAGSTKTFKFSKDAATSQFWRVGLEADAEPVYSARIRYIAYDRSQSSEVNLENVTDQTLLLDRAV